MHCGSGARIDANIVCRRRSLTESAGCKALSVLDKAEITSYHHHKRVHN